MVWVFVVPPQLPVLTANARPHWAVRYRRVRDLREWAHWRAVALKVPRCERVWAALVVYRNNARAYDPANWADTAKALIDGAVVDSRMLMDDDASRLPATVYAAGGLWPGKTKRLVLYISDQEPLEFHWWRHAEHEVLP